MVDIKCRECGTDRTVPGSVSWDVEDAKVVGHLNSDGIPVLTQISGSDLKNGSCSCGYQTLGVATYLTQPLEANLGGAVSEPAGLVATPAPTDVNTSNLSVPGSFADTLKSVVAAKPQDEMVSIPARVASTMNQALARAEALLQRISSEAQGEDAGDICKFLLDLFHTEHGAGRRALQAIEASNKAVLEWNTTKAIPETPKVKSSDFETFSELLEAVRRVDLKMAAQLETRVVPDEADRVETEPGMSGLPRSALLAHGQSRALWCVNMIASGTAPDTVIKQTTNTTFYQELVRLLREGQ